MQPLTIVVTSFNRYELTIKSFEKVIDDNRISEILIVDDASTDGSGKRLAQHFFRHPKVKVIIQAENRTMQLNKADAVFFATNDWVILLDSDNEISTGYIDALEQHEKLYRFNEGTIYAPVRALPNFIYDRFEGITIDASNVRFYVGLPYFGAMINTCNYLVHRETYLENFQFDKDIKGVDTAAHFLRHLTNKGKFHVVENLEYFHAISKDSEFMKDVHYNMACAMDIEKKLLEL